MVIERSRAGLRVLRELNSGLVVEVVRTQGPISRAAVAKLTSLAKPTVSAIVDDLIAVGTLAEMGEGKASSGGGRKPTLLAFVGRSQAVVGVDIGVHATVVVLADSNGEELARDAFDTPRTVGDALDAVAEAVRVLARRVRIARSKIVGLGICVPGLVHPDEGRCVMAPNLGWSDCDLRTPLQDALGCPVFVQNVVHATAVAEQLEGAATGSAVTAVIYDDNGIGSALAIDGRVFHGASGVAGELGHVRLPGHSLPCSCGGAGCLETVASSRALAARAGSGLDADSAYRTLAASKDPAAVELLASTAALLGQATSWLVGLMNPSVVVIAGKLLEAGPGFVDAIDEHCRNAILASSNDGLRIVASALGNDAGVRGAVLLALQASDSNVRLAFGS